MSERIFVSRAGGKLDYALDFFKINVSGLVCADFGCSTGGFTDCLLKRGASKVYAIDTAYGELDWNLRNNSQVVVMERHNVLHTNLPEKVDFICIDTGWTKQAMVVPVALKNLKPESFIVSLLKPHYEADKRYLRGGKLSLEYVDEVVSKTINSLKELDINVIQVIESPIEGKKGGNKEFLMLLSN